MKVRVCLRVASLQAPVEIQTHVVIRILGEYLDSTLSVLAEHPVTQIARGNRVFAPLSKEPPARLQARATLACPDTPLFFTPSGILTNSLLAWSYPQDPHPLLFHQKERSQHSLVEAGQRDGKLQNVWVAYDG